MAVTFEGESLLSSAGVGYFLALPWKVACAVIPPPRLAQARFTRTKKETDADLNMLTHAEFFTPYGEAFLVRQGGVFAAGAGKGKGAGPTLVITMRCAFSPVFSCVTSSAR